MENNITMKPMENNMTAVEWLVEKYIEKGIIFLDDIEQAKAMEKEQIIDAYNISWALRDKPYATADKYYNETFNKDKQ